METGKNNNSFKDCFGRTDLKENNHLVIADNAENFSYSFIDIKNSQCVGLCSFPLQETGYDKIEEQRKIIEEQSEIRKNYERTTLLFANRECTLIPEEIYRKKDNEKYINLLFADVFSAQYNAMHLPSLGNYLVYKIPASADELYREQFPGAVFYHSTGFLLNTLGRISFKQKYHLVHTHFSKNYFEMAIFFQGKLLFYNSFEFQTSEEIAYYILFALKQWGVESKEIMISGMMNPQSDELYWLKKYIPKIVGFPVDELLPYPASIEYPLNFINLLNPELCE
jgi:hypothetical protein